MVLLFPWLISPFPPSGGPMSMYLCVCACPGAPLILPRAGTGRGAGSGGRGGCSVQGHTLLGAAQRPVSCHCLLQDGSPWSHQRPGHFLLHACSSDTVMPGCVDLWSVVLPPLCVGDGPLLT